MYNRIQIREIFAWITLAIAFILFSITLSFAQTRKISVDKENGKVHLKITKKENGETVEIDTTFVATDDSDVDEIIEKFSNTNGRSHMNMKSNKNEETKRLHITIDSDISQLSESDKEKLHKEWKDSMKDMRKGIDEMKESLKDVHIQIDGDSDSNSANDFHLHFDLPDEESNDRSNCDDYSYSYKYSYSGNDEIDNLKDDDHVVIVGDNDEKPPVLEKIISSKNGKQIFVYKRSGPKGTDMSVNEKEREREEQTSEKPDIHNLHYYPNPTNGKFKLSFRSDKAGDMTVQILDDTSKEIISEKLNNFKGEYSREIDLGNKSKGNYFLKITQGEKSLTKKIILN